MTRFATRSAKFGLGSLALSIAIHLLLLGAAALPTPGVQEIPSTDFIPAPGRSEAQARASEALHERIRAAKRSRVLDAYKRSRMSSRLRDSSMMPPIVCPLEGHEREVKSVFDR